MCIYILHIGSVHYSQYMYSPVDCAALICGAVATYFDNVVGLEDSSSRFSGVAMWTNGALHLYKTQVYIHILRL